MVTCVWILLVDGAALCRFEPVYNSLLTTVARHFVFSSGFIARCETFTSACNLVERLQPVFSFSARDSKLAGKEMAMRACGPQTQKPGFNFVEVLD